jgi:V/A-type H+-transporting ATPase subunit B
MFMETVIKSSLVTQELRTVTSIAGPLITVANADNVALGEMVEITPPDSESRFGQVIQISGNNAVVQVMGITSGFDTKLTRINFLDDVARLPVSMEMLGRIFNGAGKPIDNLLPFIPEDLKEITGLTINPASRDQPSDFIQTGISAIDGMNTLVRGQKLPIFTGSGLPANEVAMQIIKQAEVKGGDPFAIVFGAIGITSREAYFFLNGFEEIGTMDRTVVFMNLADDPTIERLFVPRLALTAAEYLAFDKGIQVLVILTDITNYCDALREISSSRQEIPGRRGYPGYMYTDLATLFERAGRIKGRKGSITQLPIISMPNDDITHPVPDLTGYITEGQIILSRDLHRKGLFPPISVLPSLSRLMNLGIGENKTREDHRNLADQLYALYASGIEAKKLESIIGTEGMGEAEKRYLNFANKFEEVYINQGKYSRSIEETMNIGWELLSLLPEKDLVRVQENFVEKYYNRNKKP